MILAIDSTTKKASVALMTENNDVVVKSIDNEITHSEKLLPLIDELLSKNNVSLKQISELVCTLGPGSFTGVRIGIATVKALAKVLALPIKGITSLKLLALEGFKQNNNHKYILSTMDAKNSRVYYELFEIRKQDDKYSINSTDVQGNLPQDVLISLLKEKNIDDILVISDKKETLLNNFYDAFNAISILECELKLENIFADLSNLPSFNYDNLDAMYFRSSEAERTKNGEI